MTAKEMAIFAIASFVSADTNNDNEQRKQNVESLNKMKGKLPELVDGEDLKTLSDAIDDAVNILKKEITEDAL